MAEPVASLLSVAGVFGSFVNSSWRKGVRGMICFMDGG